MQQIKYPTLLSDGRVEASQVVIEAGVIVDVQSIPSTDCDSRYLLCPGFIDCQVNGAGGVLFNADPSLESLTVISKAIRAFGTTSFLPTLVTDSLDSMERAADAVSEAIKETQLGVLGIHFEGPHLGAEKPGVHREELIRPISESELSLYKRKDLGVKLITLAPEQVSPEQIKVLTEAGCIISIGHSNASYEQSMAAVEAGARCFTHLYNAMSGMRGREPGVIAAALESQASYGLIMDGIHVHSAMARLAYQANPNLLLVTDAMPVVGTTDDHFLWYDEPIYVQHNRLVDGAGRLAGANLTQDRAIGLAMEALHIKLPEAVRLATRNPAELLQKDNMGVIKVGARADLVLLNEQLQIEQLWQDGSPHFVENRIN